MQHDYGKDILISRTTASGTHIQKCSTTLFECEGDETPEMEVFYRINLFFKFQIKKKNKSGAIPLNLPKILHNTVL